MRENTKVKITLSKKSGVWVARTHPVYTPLPFGEPNKVRLLSCWNRRWSYTVLSREMAQTFNADRTVRGRRLRMFRPETKWTFWEGITVCLKVGGYKSPKRSIISSNVTGFIYLLIEDAPIRTSNATTNRGVYPCFMGGGVFYDFWVALAGKLMPKEKPLSGA